MQILYITHPRAPSRSLSCRFVASATKKGGMAILAKKKKRCRRKICGSCCCVVIVRQWVILIGLGTRQHACMREKKVQLDAAKKPTTRRPLLPSMHGFPKPLEIPKTSPPILAREKARHCVWKTSDSDDHNDDAHAAPLDEHLRRRWYFS